MLVVNPVPYAIAVLVLVLSFPLNSWVSNCYGDRWWARLVYFITAPGCVVLLLSLAILSIPYFLLFPERHAHSVDFQGTDEQKSLLQKYRKECKERGVFRRVIESIGIMPYSGPAWPDKLNGHSEDDWSAISSNDNR